MVSLEVLVIGMVGLVAPYLVRKWDVGAAAERARERARIDRKVFVEHVGSTESQWSRQIAGRGPEHLSLDKLTGAPESWWLEFFLVVGEHFKWTDSAESRDRRVVRQVVARLEDRDQLEERVVA